MNDSKIGTWLMRDGGTAVVLAVNPNRENTLHGLCQERGEWIIKSWHKDGRWVSPGSQFDADLIRKVSDSTELKPWKPEKRWRPWTIEEVKAKVLAGLWARRNGDCFVIQFTGFGTEHVLAADGNFIKFESLFNYWTQHDGTPCGVEVEE